MSDSLDRTIARALAIERKIAFLKRQSGLSLGQREALVQPLRDELAALLEAAAGPAVALAASPPSKASGAK